MINNFKITKINTVLQFAGLLPNDNNIEFFGLRKNKKVLWLRNGNTRYFKDLPIKVFNILKNAYLQDSIAFNILSHATKCIKQQIEFYTYYNWGDLDSTPDIKNGKLSPSENFRDTLDCKSLDFESKNINIGNHILTKRQLKIIDLIAQDLPDKAIKVELNIEQQTLDYHKSKLFKAVGVTNKTALLKKCLDHKVIQ